MKKNIAAFLVLFLFSLAFARADDPLEDGDGRKLFWKRNDNGVTSSYHYFRGYGKESGKSASKRGYGKSHGKSHGKLASAGGYGRGSGRGSGKSASKRGYGKSHGKSHGKPASAGGYGRGSGRGSGKLASKRGYGKIHGKGHDKPASAGGYGRGSGRGSGKAASKRGYGKIHGKGHDKPASAGGYGRGSGRGSGESASTRKDHHGRGSGKSIGTSKASANHGGKSSTSWTSSSKRGYGEVAHRNPNTAPGPASGRNDIPTVFRPPGNGPTLAPGYFSSIIRDKQLKLHWESGYRWQGEAVERKWCMMYRYNGWPGSGRCWYPPQLVKPCNPEEIYIATCNNDPRQRFNIIVLPDSDEAGNEIFLVQVPSTNLCFERNNKSIFLRECDIGSDLQQWMAINGRLTGEKFEITSVSKDTHCVSQAHHPKAGEVVELYRCEVPRRPDHQTSFWNAIK